MLGEVKLRCGFETIHAAAQVDLIAVEGEDLLLGEGALDLDGQIGFLQLSSCGALGREKEIARELHGERGGALHAAMAAQIVHDCSGDAQDIDAPVRLEALVFD